MKEVAMTTQVKILFTGAFDNCHMGCDSCDFVTTTHTQYKDGKAVGLTLKVRCENAELCEHMLEHLVKITSPQIVVEGDEECAKQY